MNRNHRTTRPRTKPASFLALVAAILVALSLAASSGADLVKPSVSLGPVTVLNGTATLAGSVKSPAAGTTISVNGSPLSIDAGGQFAGVVNLAGQTKRDITVRNPVTGEVSTISIPLNSNIVGPGGAISPELLSNLEQAGVSLLMQPGSVRSSGYRRTRSTVATTKCCAPSTSSMSWPDFSSRD